MFDNQANSKKMELFIDKLNDSGGQIPGIGELYMTRYQKGELQDGELEIGCRIVGRLFQMFEDDKG